MYKDKDGIVEDSFQAFLVDGADFTKEEEYPIIREDMVPQNPPTKVIKATAKQHQEIRRRYFTLAVIKISSFLMLKRSLKRL